MIYQLPVTLIEKKNTFDCLILFPVFQKLTLVKFAYIFRDLLKYILSPLAFMITASQYDTSSYSKERVEFCFCIKTFEVYSLSVSCNMTVTRSC